ncbi:MAG: type II toxin-antitoxin system HigB family toxin [Caldilineaceae bacterium SB0668_bin_21]|nr:type II toxin-antitoxin system HigB family toxin [Caldilineaceae bacterium SB0668_bin_21]MYC21389.1 type II toxin-antitoxin system HigB family toxin [Caldilineaceae bacterium SB0662_bin_25]
MQRAVRHFANPSFWQRYRRLPRDIQQVADRNFELLKRNSRHPSLSLKKVGRYWSVRVGRKYRAVAIDSDEGLVWFWIGTHAEYDKLIR